MGGAWTFETSLGSLLAWKALILICTLPGSRAYGFGPTLAGEYFGSSVCIPTVCQSFLISVNLILQGFSGAPCTVRAIDPSLKLCNMRSTDSVAVVWVLSTHNQHGLLDTIGVLLFVSASQACGGMMTRLSCAISKCFSPTSFRVKRFRSTT